MLARMEICVKVVVRAVDDHVMKVTRRSGRTESCGGLENDGMAVWGEIRQRVISETKGVCSLIGEEGLDFLRRKREFS